MYGYSHPYSLTFFENSFHDYSMIDSKLCVKAYIICESFQMQETIRTLVT